MSFNQMWLAVPVLFAGTITTAAADPDQASADVQALAAKIDQAIAAGWSAGKVQPAPLADDAEFIRRVYLHLAGRVPSVAEARAFIADTSPDKRQRVVAQLLDGPRYVMHFTNVWRALLLPEANASFQTRFLVPGLEAWIREQLAASAPYDQMARELLTAPLQQQDMQQIYAYGQPNKPTPIGYYSAKEFKPENLAASTARLFLGIRVECAQCHDHPFASWTREEFWGFAAFYAGLRPQNQGGGIVGAVRELLDKRELTIPGTTKVVQARFLDGTQPKWKYKAGPRVTLAEWMTRADNPYFAKAGVNRLWAYFFGTGLVEPIDEMVGGDATCSHPELLDELARRFAASGFDVKFLTRAITASRAYQLTSAHSHPTQDDPRLFARMAVQGLAPEQLFDSVAEATGYRERGPRQPYGFSGNGSLRAEFLSRFANYSDRPTERQTSILQALSLMNGRLIADATSLQRSETLAAVVDSPFLDTRQQIETLYLAALSRMPKESELTRALRFVDKASPNQKNQALADVFWALLNSSEFVFNH